MKKSNCVATVSLSLMVAITISTTALSQEEIIDEHVKVLMEQEIYQLWNNYLIEENIRGNDPRWEQIKDWSSDLADAVYHFQTYGEMTEDGDIIKLPVHWNTHLMIATMIIVESALDSKAIGKKLGEVGLTQLHRHARNSFTKKEIMQDPSLGIFLGVRWLAIQINLCRQSIYGWTDNSWGPSMSSYCAGIAKVWRGSRKKCRTIKVAKKRIKLMKRYRKMILEQNGKLYYDMLSSGGE